MSANSNDTAVTALLELGNPNNSDEGLSFSERLKKIRKISSDLDAMFAPYREQLQKESTASQSESSATTGNKKRKAESTGSQSESSATIGNKKRKAMLVLRKTKKTTYQSEVHMESLKNFPGNPENYNFSGGTGGITRTATSKEWVCHISYIPTKIGVHLSRVGGWT